MFICIDTDFLVANRSNHFNKISSTLHQSHFFCLRITHHQTANNSNAYPRNCLSHGARLWGHWTLGKRVYSFLLVICLKRGFPGCLMWVFFVMIIHEMLLFSGGWGMGVVWIWEYHPIMSNPYIYQLLWLMGWVPVRGVYRVDFLHESIHSSSYYCSSKTFRSKVGPKRIVINGIISL